MRVSKIEFRAGPSENSAPLSLKPSRVTIFIGPNNGGKSQALRDIAAEFGVPQGLSGGVVASSVKLRAFTDDEFNARFAALTRSKTSGEDPNPAVVPIGRRGGWQMANLDVLKQGMRGQGNERYFAQIFLPHLLLNLGGENRLHLANPVGSDSFSNVATTTVSVILRDNHLRKKISELVHDAVGRYLVVDPTAMSQLSYSLADVAPINELIERSFTDDAIEYFSSCQNVSTTSDGTRAFIGILTEVMAGDHEVLLIDEPEAFLHPSLAYFLGREIVMRLGEGRQLFAATHSPHFLRGCIEAGVDVQIVRLTYNGKNGSARSLSAESLKDITTDPLLKSIGVTNALFYQSAIVCEGDSDRAFYSEVASRLINVKQFRHSIFLNGHSKQSLPNIIKVLRSLGIPTASIMDIDWLKEDGTVGRSYAKSAGVPDGMIEAFMTARRTVRQSLERADPDYKRNGGTTLLSGEEKRAADDFFKLAEGYGIYTVRRGELESWLPSLSVSRTKGRWLPEIFAAMGSDPNTSSYIHPSTDDVWDFLSCIGLALETT